MEQKPHVPGYGKGEAMGRDLDREMTIEELEAMEVPKIEVIKQGIVRSKVEALKKPSATEQKFLRETLLRKVDALTMKPVHNETERRARDMEVQRLKDQLDGISQTGNA